MTEEKKLEDFLPNKNGSYYKKFELKNEASLINQEEIIKCIKTVMDPEIPINLYDLGLIYNIEQSDNGDVGVLMTLTAPNCPVAGEMPKMVADSIIKIDGVGIVTVKLTWSPKWTKDMMSDDAKFALADIF